MSILPSTMTVIAITRPGGPEVLVPELRPLPKPGDTEILIRVAAAGVNRPDVFQRAGSYPPPKGASDLPGLEVAGEVAAIGAGVSRWKVGDKVCALTPGGGYAQYALAPEDFVYPIPESFAAQQAAPLLCAGIIGFRSLRLSGIKAGGKLAFYGFGAAAHVAIQVARDWGVEVYACTRGGKHQQLALQLGAVWAGESAAEPPEKLDAAIIFAPAGELVPFALKALRKGGVLVLGGIHMSPIPSLDYNLLYQERVIRSVANNTRQDGEDFLRLAAAIPIRTQVTVFPLRDANRALNDLKSERINGAAVLDCTL